MLECAEAHAHAWPQPSARREPARLKRRELPRFCATLREPRGCPGADEASLPKTWLCGPCLEAKAHSRCDPQGACRRSKTPRHSGTCNKEYRHAEGRNGWL